ncbi:MAG: aminotransferase class I/II-fold pyridoxal phosphate-dependent enzyme [bacterium]
MKKTIHDLAIHSGIPEFKEKLHVGLPNLGNRESLMKRINKILDTRWFTNNGPLVQEFEKELIKTIGVKHCIAMCNGTVALEIAIRALGLTGEVIVPSFTFIATAHALQWQGITPIFCDISLHNYTIDPCMVEKMVTPRTSGIIGVHLWGRSCDIEALTHIAKKHNISLIFDAAHAFACSHKGHLIGGFGDAEIFSFHATKFLNTFEGGAVMTNNDELAEKIRLMKNFGFQGKDNVIHIGVNGKMSEISAAMGLSSLECIEEFIMANYRNYKYYYQELERIPGIRLVSYDDRERFNYQYIVLIIDEEVTGISRDRLVEILHAENIIARRYFYPGCHKMEPYRSYSPHAGMMLPNTEKFVHKVLILPTGPTIDQDHIKRICTILRVAIENSSDL